MPPFLVLALPRSLQQQPVLLRPVNGVLRILGKITRWAEELDIPDPVRSAQNEGHDVISVPHLPYRESAGWVGAVELLPNSQCLDFVISMLAFGAAMACTAIAPVGLQSASIYLRVGFLIVSYLLFVHFVISRLTSGNSLLVPQQISRGCGISPLFVLCIPLFLIKASVLFVSLIPRLVIRDRSSVIGLAPLLFCGKRVFSIRCPPRGISRLLTLGVGRIPRGMFCGGSLRVFSMPLSVVRFYLLRMCSSPDRRPLLLLLGIRDLISSIGGCNTASTPRMKPIFRRLSSSKLSVWFVRATPGATLCAIVWFSHFGRSCRSGGQGRNKPGKACFVPHSNALSC